MALGNEMIDRGIWTTPMGLPTPRLLYHFMGTPVSFSVDEGSGRRLLAIATIKHPLFYNLLDRGLKTKNPVFIGAALHLLIDTFYHAGYSNLLGHAEGGHHFSGPPFEYDPGNDADPDQRVRADHRQVVEVEGAGKAIGIGGNAAENMKERLLCLI